MYIWIIVLISLCICDVVSYSILYVLLLCMRGNFVYVCMYSSTREERHLLNDGG